MAFIFTMRSTPVDGMNRRDLTPTTSLPAIAEDRDAFIAPRHAPPLPPRALNRPANKVFGLGAPPRLNYDFSPPEYSQFDSTGVEGPHGEKLSDVRKGISNNKHIAKRGGWKRLAIIAAIVTLVLVGLIVGLVVGLRNRNKSSSNRISGSGTPTGGASGTAGGSGSGNPASNTTFPAGSYRIDTYLSTVATDCTSNPATWTCYPYSTYAQNPSGSEAAYDWIITPVDGTNNYTISSTPNFFSILFSNVSVSLMDQGTDQEHYYFQTTMQKPTKPGQLGSTNVASTCYFNDTTFQAYLYTKMERTYPANSTSSNDTMQAFAAWPYAVRVEQVATSAAGTPDCVDPSGKSLGDFSVSESGRTCNCSYLNTGT